MNKESESELNEAAAAASRPIETGCSTVVDSFLCKSETDKMQW